MIKLTALLKRKPGMTRAEFEAYWRDVHGPLVRSTKSGSYVLRYEQHPRVDDGRDGWDGITEQWFESVDSFLASLAEDDYKLIDEDTRKFLDVDGLQFLLTDEPRVIME